MTGIGIQIRAYRFDNPAGPMTVSRKGKRRIIIKEREFLWWIGEKDELFLPEGLAESVQVVLPEGGFYLELQRGLNNPARSCVLINAKPGGPIPSGCFHCPVFDTTAVTPRTVRTLIEWVFDPATVLLPMDWYGRLQTAPNATPSADGNQRGGIDD